MASGSTGQSGCKEVSNCAMITPVLAGLTADVFPYCLVYLFEQKKKSNPDAGEFF